MRAYISISILLVGVLGHCQGKKSKGDAYFFQYAYEQAIAAYEEEKEEKGLSQKQQLNLADAYFKTKKFENAADIYFEAYKKDSLLNNHQFNNMLQSFSKTDAKERVTVILGTKTDVLGKELAENTKFNLQVLQQADANEDSKFEIFNLQSNGEYSDFAPAFYKEKLLYSSGRPKEKRRQYAPMGESYLDIYIGRIRSNGQLLNPNTFDAIPPSNYHKATPYYSETLNSLFYVLSNTKRNQLLFDDNGKNALGIGLQPLGGEFRLLLKDLSTSFYYPFYDAESEKLYFAADFGNGYGGTDIYFIYTNRGQVMSAPINLGPRINSPGNEIAPFIFENSLYFSSDVFYGLGGMDVYKSNIEGKDQFSIPVNLGPDLNSPKDDFGFIIRREDEGLLGYFSSNRVGGKGKDDIYGFRVDKKPGLKTITLRGNIHRASRSSYGIESAQVQLLDSEGNLLEKVTSRKDGSYRIEIPWRENVKFQVQKERYTRYEETFDFSGGQETYISKDIGIAYYDNAVEERENQKVVKLNDFYFDRGKTVLTPAITQELDKAVNFAKGFPKVKLRIETHTDSRGSSSTNLRLTKKRSDSIRKYLIENGVAESSIPESVGYGEKKLLNNCTNGAFCIELLHQQNQRTLIVILNEDELFDNE